MRSLEKNQTWEVVDRAQMKDVKPLTSRWVFKIKNDGIYKARLVVRGCEQRHGFDYTETFSPVVSADSLRVIFAIASKRNYKMYTLDIKTAFLYGELDETIYMYPLEGYNL